MSDELIDQVIAHGFLAQQVYSKVRFDNAKDTKELITAAQDNADMVKTAIKARITPYIEELLEHRLRKFMDESDGKVALTLGGGRFVLVKVEEES